MIHLHQIAFRDFVFLRMDETVASARQKLGLAKERRAIVQGNHQEFWIFEIKAFCELCRDRDGHGVIGELVAGLPMRPVPALDLMSDAIVAPSLCVVLDGDRVFGYCDAQLPPSHVRSEDYSRPRNTSREELSDILGQKAPVALGLSAPPAAMPGADFTVTVAAYAPNAEDKVAKILTGLSRRAEAHLGLFASQWKRGTKVLLHCSGRHLSISEPAQSLEWRGYMELVSFDVTVSADAPEETIVLKVDVFIEEFCVARLRADLDIRHRIGTPTAVVKSLDCSSTAFASYSHKDRERVLDKVSSIQVSAGLDIFVECLDLKPSEAYQVTLKQEIQSRDLFLLFWSQHSRQSKWVAWELENALRCKRDSIQIHPLEPSDVAPPPKGLEHLHFGDPLILIRDYYVQRGQR